MNTKSLKIILSILVLMFLCILAGTYKYKSDIDAKRFYKQGMSFYKKGNYSDAYYNFKQISIISNIYALSLLKQYMCADKLDDKKTAHAKLVELIKYTKNPHIRPYAMYNEAVLAHDMKINSKIQSLKKYKKILSTHPDNNFYYASAYKAALLSDNKQFAKDKYIEYLKYAPVGKYSLPALSNINNLNNLLSNEDKIIIADSYFLNSKYEQALKYYQEAEFSSVWYKISKCYRQLNKYEEEKNAIIKGINLRYSNIEEKDIDLALNRLASLNKSSKVQFFQDLYIKYQNNYIYPTVIYNLAESSQSIHSIKLYEEIVKKYPSSSWASNSLWEIFWYNYSLNRFNTCIKLGEIHQNKYSKSSDAPRVMYWTARAMLNEKKNQNARELFYKTIKEYPLSYYAFLSTKRLKFTKANNIIVKKNIPNFDMNSLNNHLFKNDNLLLFLAQNDDIETIDELKINDEYIKSWIMFKKENYPNSINTAKNEYLNNIKENDEINASYKDKELKLIYPILYNNEINEHAHDNKISPYLFLSIIREESHFNKNAQSQAGATGLVQLMPDTASFIEKTAVSKETLMKDNIRIGAKYFKYLIDMFDKNEYLAILSYNAGPGNVKKWLNDPFISHDDIDEFVENIPYSETKSYIKKVLSAYWIYFNIYK